MSALKQLSCSAMEHDTMRKLLKRDVICKVFFTIFALTWMQFGIAMSPHSQGTLRFSGPMNVGESLNASNCGALKKAALIKDGPVLALGQAGRVISCPTGNVAHGYLRTMGVGGAPEGSDTKYDYMTSIQEMSEVEKNRFRTIVFLGVCPVSTAIGYACEYTRDAPGKCGYVPITADVFGNFVNHAGFATPGHTAAALGDKTHDWKRSPFVVGGTALKRKLHLSSKPTIRLYIRGCQYRDYTQANLAEINTFMAEAFPTNGSMGGWTVKSTSWTRGAPGYGLPNEGTDADWKDHKGVLVLLEKTH